MLRPVSFLAEVNFPEVNFLEEFFLRFAFEVLLSNNERRLPNAYVDVFSEGFLFVEVFKEEFLLEEVTATDGRFAVVWGPIWGAESPIGGVRGEVGVVTTRKARLRVAEERGVDLRLSLNSDDGVLRGESETRVAPPR